MTYLLWHQWRKYSSTVYRRRHSRKIPPKKSSQVYHLFFMDFTNRHTTWKQREWPLISSHHSKQSRASADNLWPRNAGRCDWWQIGFTQMHLKELFFSRKLSSWGHTLVGQQIIERGKYVTNFTFFDSDLWSVMMVALHNNPPSTF